MSNTCKILIIDDEEQLLIALATMLNGRHEVSTTTSLEGAMELLKHSSYDIVLLDIRLENGTSGLDLLAVTHELQPAPAVVLMSAFIDKPIAISATNNGALGILEKPFDSSEVYGQIDRLMKLRDRQKHPRSINIDGSSISLDSNNFRLRTPTGSLSLTKTEYQILSLLMAKPNQWIQRDALEIQIWPGIQVSRNTLDTHFSNLKKRIPELRNYFESRRGLGIRFVKDQTKNKDSNP